MPHFIVIGGGIVGSAIALKLAERAEGKVTVLEKEASLGAHASGRNSGVIHSGINQRPGSLKAKMCVEGSRLLRDYCKRHGVPVRECGTLVIARKPTEEGILQKLLQMGNECGVPGLRLIDRTGLKKREPLAKGIAALFSPSGATVDSLKLLQTVAGEAREKGVQYCFSHKVIGIEGRRIKTTEGEWIADHFINCAGLDADHIAQMAGAGKNYRVIPFRGEYMEVEHCEVNSMIYQPPDLGFPFLSIHLTRETDGRVLAGPTATLAFGREAYQKEWDFREMAGMFLSRPFQRLAISRHFLGLALSNFLLSVSKRAFLKEVQSLVEGVELNQLVPFRSGIRAQMVDSDGKLVNDLLIETAEFSTHILNAVSPGLTSSLAFADYVIANHLAKAAF